MRPAGVLIGLLLACAAASPVLAAPAVLSERPEEVALTIYPDQASRHGELRDQELAFDGKTGLALVTEWRTVEVPAGEIVLSFRGVAEGIVPETAAIEGLPAALVEQNQDFDLLSPGSLIVRSTGAAVKRVRTDRATGRETVENAIIRSTAKGVVLEIDGQVQAMGCGGDAERLIFDRVPEGLTDKPTLSARLRVREPGRYHVKLSYLAVGLLWQANYVGHVQADGTLNLTGWITLRNLSGTTFADAPTQFVAGDLEKTGETVATEATVQHRPRGCWPMDTTSGRPYPRLQPRPPAPAPMYDDMAVGEIVVTAQRRQNTFQDVPIALVAEESDLGDYKLYTLPIPTTIAARQTKQVMMLVQPEVKLKRVTRFYVDPWDYDPDDEAGAFAPDDEDGPTAKLVLTGKNRKAEGLGVSLPGGKLILTQTGADGRLQLVEETALYGMPVGALVEINAGESSDVIVRPRLVRRWAVGNRTRSEYELAAVNLTSRPATFEIAYGYDDVENPRVVRGGRGVERRPYGFVWSHKLNAGQTGVYRFTIEGDD